MLLAREIFLYINQSLHANLCKAITTIWLPDTRVSTLNRIDFKHLRGGGGGETELAGAKNWEVFFLLPLILGDVDAKWLISAIMSLGSKENLPFCSFR